MKNRRSRKTNTIDSKIEKAKLLLEKAKARCDRATANLKEPTRKS